MFRGPADQSPNSSEHFGHNEWLGYIIIGARIEAFDAFAYFASSAQDQNGCGNPSGPDFFQYAQAIPAREHDIEKDHIEILREDLRKGSVATFNSLYGETSLAQGMVKNRGDLFFVFGDENPVLS